MATTEEDNDDDDDDDDDDVDVGVNVDSIDQVSPVGQDAVQLKVEDETESLAWYVQFPFDGYLDDYESLRIIREAIPRQLCSFFKHCSNGGGIKPMLKNFVANILLF